MSLFPYPPRAGRAQGFTLLEALIALTILGVALLMSMALVLQLPRDVRRLDAERHAMRAMEATLEGMRAGTLPIEPSKLRDLITVSETSAARDLEIDVAVTGTPRPGLCKVTLTASYLVLKTKHQKQLQALIRSGC
jgi:prepilin-type N-terminal cleavage/methylation domain-containing protein